MLAALTVVGLAGIVKANIFFAPEMYSRKGPVEFAEAFARGENFAVFDLNINIREMRDEHIKRMPKAPEVVVLGASHWQEAHRWLIPSKDYYNAHVHRDYFEDMLAMTEMFVRHDKLPKQMIIAIRDKLFTPVHERKDFLWLPGNPYYRDFARRIGIPQTDVFGSLPVQRWREVLSLPMLYANTTRYANASVMPQATSEYAFEDLDVLLPGGSILWSAEHRRLFTPERSRAMSMEFAASVAESPPIVDPLGVQSLDALFKFLKGRGVEVIFAHPPFNPLFYDRANTGAYAAGLRRIEAITQDFARKYGWTVIGSFDPHKVGCTEQMYIDAEHANPTCLAKVFNQYNALYGGKPAEDDAAGEMYLASARESARDGAANRRAAEGDKTVLAGSTVMLPRRSFAEGETRADLAPGWDLFTKRGGGQADRLASVAAGHRAHADAVAAGRAGDGQDRIASNAAHHGATAVRHAAPGLAGHLTAVARSTEAETASPAREAGSSLSAPTARSRRMQASPARRGARRPALIRSRLARAARDRSERRAALVVKKAARNAGVKTMRYPYAARVVRRGGLTQRPVAQLIWPGDRAPAANPIVRQ